MSIIPCHSVSPSLRLSVSPSLRLSVSLSLCLCLIPEIGLMPSPHHHWALINFIHHPPLHRCDQAAARGDSLATAIEDSSVCLLNTDSPTRVPNNSNPSSPYISLISAHLALSASCTTNVLLNSDHLPITINFDDDPPPIRVTRTFTNFRLARWADFVAESELLFSHLPPPASCAAGEANFRKVMLTASKHNIPSGFRKSFTPGLPHEAVDLTKRRDELRCLDPLDPEIPILNNNISETIRKSSKKACIDKVESCSLQSNPIKYWSLLRNLSGKRAHQPPNQPIHFGTKTLTKAFPIAKRFNHQFTSVSTHKQNPNKRRIMRALRGKHKLDPNFAPFTEAATEEVIRQSSNSTAVGPDGFTAVHLKHLGHYGRAYLTRLFNLSIRSANLPAIRKMAHIIPILKPGKPPNLSSSYRPISLLSPMVKILERLLLPYITSSLPHSNTQHGFVPFHSTTISLLPLDTKVANGFNENKLPTHTAAIAIDISKAFDGVDHTLLLQQISNSPLNSNIVRWLATYIRGRTASCLFRARKSPLRIIHSGVPQGSVLSPALFNHFVSDLPTHAALTSSYTDDFNIGESSPNLPTITTALSEDLTHISQ